MRDSKKRTCAETLPYKGTPSASLPGDAPWGEPTLGGYSGLFAQFEKSGHPLKPTVLMPPTPSASLPGDAPWGEPTLGGYSGLFAQFEKSGHPLKPTVLMPPTPSASLSGMPLENHLLSSRKASDSLPCLPKRSMTRQKADADSTATPPIPSNSFRQPIWKAPWEEPCRGR